MFDGAGYLVSDYQISKCGYNGVALYGMQTDGVGTYVSDLSEI